MKVVEALEQDKTEQAHQQKSNVIKMKKFKFVMLHFHPCIRHSRNHHLCIGVWR